MFIDVVDIYLRSGSGGDGAVHFHREKFINRGGPDGGDGGRGGDVVLVVTIHLNTLATFRHKSHFIAQNGARGGSNNMSGRSAEDLIILVPAGTIIYDANSNEILGDLVTPGEKFVICKSGRGGRGNQHFATSRRQAPRIAEKGEPGEEKQVRLELKLIADVGIVGVPNAGKSSLLAAVTNARPKIADYPFTTLEPSLGVAELDENTTLVLADIPGLVEGAHLGTGLGDAFLKHIQRTRVLIHLLDGQSQDPIADFTQINSELALFDPALAKKPQIVAINKVDLPEVEQRLPALKAALKKRGIQVEGISALERRNLEPLLWRSVELLKSSPQPEPEDQMPVYRPPEDKRSFSIERVSDGWQVHGAGIERAAAMTYWEHDESVRRFQRLMERLGVEAALRKAGIKEGETVHIGEYELEWQD